MSSTTHCIFASGVGLGFLLVGGRQMDANEINKS